jgi:hypothetical protein
MLHVCVTAGLRVSELVGRGRGPRRRRR